MITGWLHFADPAFDFEFDYPLESGDAPVTLRRVPHAGGEAVHLSTADGRTVYFEIDRTDRRMATAGAAALSADVHKSFADAWFGEPEETHLCGEPALSLRFRFADRMRWAIFTEKSMPSYRVILDPRSSTNLAILGSLTRAE